MFYEGDMKGKRLSRFSLRRGAEVRIVISRAAPRAAKQDGPQSARRTLKTGYCDRKIDEDRPAKFECLNISSEPVNFSESEISGILGRDLLTTHMYQALPENLNGEFDPGSG